MEKEVREARSWKDELQKDVDAVMASYENGSCTADNAVQQLENFRLELQAERDSLATRVVKLKSALQADIQKRTAVLSAYKAMVLSTSYEVAMATASAVGKSLGLTDEQVREVVSSGAVAPSEARRARTSTAKAVESGTKLYRVTVGGADRGTVRSGMELARKLAQNTRPALITAPYTAELKAETGLDLTTLSPGEKATWTSPTGIEVVVVRE